MVHSKLAQNLMSQARPPQMDSSMTQPLAAQVRRTLSSGRRFASASSGSGGGGGPSMTEMEALIGFVELMGRSHVRPTVPECRAALLTAAGVTVQP